MGVHELRGRGRQPPQEEDLQVILKSHEVAGLWKTSGSGSYEGELGEKDKQLHKKELLFSRLNVKKVHS